MTLLTLVNRAGYFDWPQVSSLSGVHCITTAQCLHNKSYDTLSIHPSRPIHVSINLSPKQRSVASLID